MRYGVCILPDLTWHQSRPLWQRAEELGFDHAWTYDHLVWGGLPDSQWFSCIPTLTAAAAVTRTIRLGAFVISPNFRHPVSTSREIQTLSDISDGRFIAGLGVGGTPDDRILGQSELTVRQRVDRFQEFVGLLDRTLSDDHVDADGEYYRARNMRLVGGSQRDRIPLVLAGNGRRTVRFAALHGDAWVTTGRGGDTIDEWFAGIANLTEILDESLSSTGRAIDRYLSLDAGPRSPLDSIGVFDEMIGRADELGFTDVVVHWPRETEPYRGSVAVLEEIAGRSAGQETFGRALDVPRLPRQWDLIVRIVLIYITIRVSSDVKPLTLQRSGYLRWTDLMYEMEATMTDTSTQSAPTEGGGLRRDVGLIGLLFASVGSIIGSGWLFGAMNAAQKAGPAAIISWTLGAIMILLIALTFAELGTMFPVSGGVVRFPHIAFGSFASYTSGWILWIACGTVAPIEVEGALQYATKYAAFTTKNTVNGQIVHTLTGLGYATAFVLLALFVVINYIGVRWFARINNVLVWWKLGIIVVVIVAFLLTRFHGQNFTSQGFMPNGWPGVFTAIATSGIVFSFLGFRQGIELAGETSNPRKYVPIAVIGSVLLTGILYVALQVAFIGSLNPRDFIHGWSTMGFQNDFGPLAAIATAIGLGWLATLLYIDAIISPGDTGLIYTTVTARVSYAMARNGNAPRALAKTTHRGVPLISLLVAFVVGLIVLLPFPSWQQLVGFITSATVLSFAAGPVVVATLRRSAPDLPRPFRVAGGDVIPVLAFIASNLIVVWSTWTINFKLFIAVLIGLVLLAILEMVYDQPVLEMRSGSWMIIWLAGLALLSYLAGDLDSSAILGFWPANIITVVFSIIVFYLAIRFRLPEATMREHMDSITAEAALEEGELGPAAA